MYRVVAGIAGLVAVWMVGCFGASNVINRSQMADDALEKEAFATIGQRTEIGNMDPIPITGVGFVYNLMGTGSNPPQDGYRNMLEQAIRRQKGNPKELLDDPNKTISLVLVNGVIPPGARQGDRIDVAISLPPGSRTTSLKNGVLWPTDLQNFELAANARAAMQQSGIPVGKVPVVSEGTMLAGNRIAIAEGALIAGKDEASEAEGDGLRAGRIWNGGKCTLDRPYYFLLKESNSQPRLALVVAERLNAVFHAAGDRVSKLAEAKVQGKPMVVAFVPPSYRLNHNRFLLVARNVPLQPIAPDSVYRAQLANELLQPENALLAAIKLEALGNEGRQSLRVGLQSESPWVRFAAAESLAYLGHSDGARDLAELANLHPSLRTQCLTALASLDDAICLEQLADLMKKSDPQLRYGAFVALKSADEKHDSIRGLKVNNSFMLHQVAPESAPMIHISADRKSEIVLFGSRFPVSGPFSFGLGKEYVVAAKSGEPTVTITRVATKNGEPVTVDKRCLADVATIIKTLGEMGAGYVEAIEFIKRAEKQDAITTVVHTDNAPRGLSIQQLSMIARTDPNLQKADAEVVRIGSPDVVQAGFDLPNEADAVKAKPAVAEELPGTRGPGRLFGPKRPGLEGSK
jgi:hypothetical protein